MFTKWTPRLSLPRCGRSSPPRKRSGRPLGQLARPQRMRRSHLSTGGRQLPPLILLPTKTAGRTRAAFSLHPHSASLRPPLAGCAGEIQSHVPRFPMSIMPARFYVFDGCAARDASACALNSVAFRTSFHSVSTRPVDVRCISLDATSRGSFITRSVRSPVGNAAQI